MEKIRKSRVSAVLGCAVGLASAALVLPMPPAAAQGGEISFAGKRVHMLVGSAPGGGYDTFTRTIAAHIGRHLPGTPPVIVENMPGAGSLLMTNHLYNVAPKDGTVVGGVNPQVATLPLVKPEGVRFDPTKLTWLGSALRDTNIGLAWHATGIESFDEAFTREMIVGGSGGATTTFPTFLNAILGTKFKLISGYKGTREALLAMERNETDSNVGITWPSLKATQPGWLKENKVRILVQFGMKAHPELPTVPLISKYAKNDEQMSAMNLVFARQEFGRPYAGPPGLSPEVTAVWRKAFDATMADPEFLAEAGKRKLDIDPLDGRSIETLIAGLHKTPKPILDRVKEFLADSD